MNRKEKEKGKGMSKQSEIIDFLNSIENPNEFLYPYEETRDVSVLLNAIKLPFDVKQGTFLIAINKSNLKDKFNKIRTSPIKRSQDFKNKISKFQKKRYSDPNERNKQSVISKNMWKDDQVRAKITTSIHKAYSSGKPQKKISKAINELQSNSDYVHKRNSNVKAVRSTIKSRKKSSLSSSKYWKEISEEEYKLRCENMKFALSKEGVKQKISAGVLENIQKDPTIYDRMIETKRKNKTFNSSKSEEKAYEYLKSIFGDDIKRQYKSKEYPFSCDFYIEHLKLYIECDFSWTHGGHLFQNSSEYDIIKVCELYEKAKNSKYYANVLQNWVVTDPLKHWYQIKNNLNFIRAYTFDDLQYYIERKLDE